jgi:hypothetical protein
MVVVEMPTSPAGTGLAHAAQSSLPIVALWTFLSGSELKRSEKTPARRLSCVVLKPRRSLTVLWCVLIFVSTFFVPESKRSPTQSSDGTDYDLNGSD